MAFPTEDFNHATEGVALLTDHYRNQINIPAILNCITPQIQALETMFWQIIEDFLLTNSPVGDQLNSIGSIVGAQRGYLSDAQYLQLILIQIAVNRSQGLSNDIITIATLAEQNYGPLPNYLDVNNRNFLVECWNLPYPQVIWPLLSEARAIATRGVFHYSTWTDGSDFEFMSRYATSIGELGWSSRYSATTGGLMVAGEQF